MIDKEKSIQIFNDVKELFEKHKLTSAEEMYIVNELSTTLIMSRIFSIIELSKMERK